MPQPLWGTAKAPTEGSLATLAYRSRLLGADRSVCNIYGGNTSAKLTTRDHLGRDVCVLWVKGSGGDVADITEQGFASSGNSSPYGQGGYERRGEGGVSAALVREG